MADNDIAIRLIMFITAARRGGDSDAVIQEKLTEAGMSNEDAAKTISLVPPPTANSIGDTRTGLGDIMLGLALIFVGVVITAATYSSASKSGGHFVVMTGLILFGIVRVIRGIAVR